MCYLKKLSELASRNFLPKILLKMSNASSDENVADGRSLKANVSDSGKKTTYILRHVKYFNFFMARILN